MKSLVYKLLLIAVVFTVIVGVKMQPTVKSVKTEVFATEMVTNVDQVDTTDNNTPRQAKVVCGDEKARWVHYVKESELEEIKAKGCTVIRTRPEPKFPAFLKVLIEEKIPVVVDWALCKFLNICDKKDDKKTLKE